MEWCGYRFVERGGMLVPERDTFEHYKRLMADDGVQAALQPLLQPVMLAAQMIDIAARMQEPSSEGWMVSDFFAGNSWESTLEDIDALPEA